MSERLKEALDAIIEAHGFGLDVPHTLSEAIERAKAIVAGEVEAAEAEAAWWKKKHGEDAGGLMDKWRTERARAEAAEASAAAMREALWSVGAELVHRKPSHIDHAPDEDCEACVFEAMLQHIDRALSSSAGVALLERLRKAEERTNAAEASLDKTDAYVLDLEKERDELRERRRKREEKAVIEEAKRIAFKEADDALLVGLRARAEAAEAEVKRLREVMDRVGSDWRRLAKKAEAELEHQMVNLADWRDLAVRRLTEIESAEASAAAMREALEEAHPHEHARRGLPDNPVLDCRVCAALSSSAGVELLERLRTAEEHERKTSCRFSEYEQEAEARIARLEEALRKYGMHLVDCDPDIEGVCTCGLDGALEGK